MNWLPLTQWWRPRAAKLARALRFRVLVPVMHWLSRIELVNNNAAQAARDIARLRIETCKTCPLFSRGGFCDRSKGGCGCYMPFKTQLANAVCPKGKW